MEFLMIYIVIVFLLFYAAIYKIHKKIQFKVWFIFGVVILGYTASMYILSAAWYDKNSTSFHWFDDSQEWLGMDKLGHLFSSAAWSRLLCSLFIFAGLEKQLAQRRLVWAGFVMCSSAEYFDGLSPAYGASFFDIAANFAGSLFVFLQYRYWRSLQLFSKFSFYPNILSAIRPNILGSNLAEQSLKNYNGQIYWFSYSLKSIFPKSRIPQWLYLSVGYGAEGMIGGDDNIWTDASGAHHNRTDIARYRQIYISIDINPIISEGQSYFKRTLYYILTIIKFPFPAIELSIYKGIKFHWIAV